jgi:hypothetical protein
VTTNPEARAPNAEVEPYQRGTRSVEVQPEVWTALPGLPLWVRTTHSHRRTVHVDGRHVNLSRHPSSWQVHVGWNPPGTYPGEEGDEPQPLPAPLPNTTPDQLDYWIEEGDRPEPRANPPQRIDLTELNWDQYQIRLEDPRDGELNAAQRRAVRDRYRRVQENPRFERADDRRALQVDGATRDALARAHDLTTALVGRRGDGNIGAERRQRARELRRVWRLIGSHAPPLGMRRVGDVMIVRRAVRPPNEPRRERGGTPYRQWITVIQPPDLQRNLNLNGAGVGANPRWIEVRWSLLMELVGRTPYPRHGHRDLRPDVEVQREAWTRGQWYLRLRG